MRLKALMLPTIKDFSHEESGIKRVVEAYTRLLPDYGIDLVTKDASFDLVISHAGTVLDPDVLVCHGLYWTADYNAGRWEWDVNGHVISAARYARRITVPSSWVAETFRRDMRINPTVVPHGIEWRDWENNEDCEGYVLWNKNRIGDVCDATPVSRLAERFPNVDFMTTLLEDEPTPNITVMGLVNHATMKTIVQRSAVYLSTTKETFGIGVLEAMAAGIPVLGFAFGGNLDLVQHGINGYLAHPNDYEDLANGLEYCLDNRETLGENGRYIARSFTWENAVEKIAAVCKEAAEEIHQPPTVGVVIPTYNYGKTVGRSIESCLNQELMPDKVIVVDDGSTDDGETARIVESYHKKDSRVIYHRQDNAGVANARNAGISRLDTKYVCCLDADDMIEPQFLKACVDALEKKPDLGIAYTGLRYIKPDGSTGMSQWPGNYNYDLQLKKQNQIPTCCVFRMKMWERLGGYRQRYAPKGAGTEDAEFWTRAGAYGFRGEKVTDAGLFVYSWLSGGVTGNKNYQEVYWLAWHPWVEDGRHPFASLATPSNLSHAVRQYDHPLVSVIIPVSKKHVDKVVDALDSLEAQTFRNWEAIVVLDGWSTEGKLETVYPYIKIVETGDVHGAGYARNRGVEVARGTFLLFLDADDWLDPRAIEKMLSAYQDKRSIIYTDYVGKAFISHDMAVQKDKEDRLMFYDESNGEAVILHKAHDYDCVRAVSQPDITSLYHWCLITSLVLKEWHDEIGGFDEKMESWEDWDYFIRLAKAGKCFTRVQEPLVIYRFYTGTRREDGISQHKNLIEYLTRKYEGVKTMPCTGCSSSQYNSPPPNQLSDKDVVLIEYVHPNVGQHKVVGMATGTIYGYRGGGEKFYVDMRDARVQPDLYRVIEANEASIEQDLKTTPEITTPPPPEKLSQETTAPKKRIPIKNRDRLKTDLQLVPGITPEIKAKLVSQGITSVAALVKTDHSVITEMEGVSDVRKQMIVEFLDKQKGNEQPD